MSFLLRGCIMLLGRNFIRCSQHCDMLSIICFINLYEENVIENFKRCILVVALDKWVCRNPIRSQNIRINIGRNRYWVWPNRQQVKRGLHSSSKKTWLKSRDSLIGVCSWRVTTFRKSIYNYEYGINENIKTMKKVQY